MDKREMTRYKALIQIRINKRYDKADKFYVQYQLHAFMKKMMKVTNIVDDYDVSIEDSHLRQGVYDYA